MVDYQTDALGNLTAPMETTELPQDPKRLRVGKIAPAQAPAIKNDFKNAAATAKNTDPDNTNVMQAKAALRILGYNGYEADQNNHLRPDVGDVDRKVDDQFRTALQAYRDDHNRTHPTAQLGSAATIGEILQTMFKAILTPEGMARMKDMTAVATPGETNQNVKAVQSVLNARGLDVTPNGIPDARTTAALAVEQARSNIAAFKPGPDIDKQMVYDGYVDVDKIEAKRPIALNDLTDQAPVQTVEVEEPGRVMPVSLNDAPAQPAPAAEAAPVPQPRAEPENTMPDSSLGQFITNANPVAQKPWFGGEDAAAPAAATETAEAAAPAASAPAPAQQTPVQAEPARPAAHQDEGRFIRTQAPEETHSYRGPLGRNHPNYGTSDNPYNRGGLSGNFNTRPGMLGGPQPNAEGPTSIFPPGFRISGQGGRITNVNLGRRLRF